VLRDVFSGGQGGPFLRHPAQRHRQRGPPCSSRDAQNFLSIGQPVALVVAGTFEQGPHHAAHMDRASGSTPEDCRDDFDVAEISNAEGQAIRPKRSGCRACQIAPIPWMNYPPAGHARLRLNPPCRDLAQLGWRKLTPARVSIQMLKYNVNELGDALGVDAENCANSGALRRWWLWLENSGLATRQLPRAHGRT